MTAGSKSLNTWKFTASNRFPPTTFPLINPSDSILTSDTLKVTALRDATDLSGRWLWHPRRAGSRSQTVFLVNHSQVAHTKKVGQLRTDADALTTSDGRRSEPCPAKLQHIRLLTCCGSWRGGLSSSHGHPRQDSVNATQPTVTLASRMPVAIAAATAASIQFGADAGASVGRIQPTSQSANIDTCAGS